MTDIVGSYSLINNWKTCQHRAYRQHIKRDLPKQPSTPELDWGNQVHDAFKARIKDKIPLPDDMKHWEFLLAPLDQWKIEPELGIGVDQYCHPTDGWRGSFLYCKIDCPIIWERNAHLVDWKTGNDRYEDPLELMIQALVLHARHPHLKKLTGQYCWLRRKNNHLGTFYDLSDTERTWREVCAHMSNVDDALRLGEFPKTPGPLCYGEKNGKKWQCPVIDCEHNRGDK